MPSSVMALTPSADSLALLTDLYELTMAYSYWKSGMADKEAVFHLSFRGAPFQSGFIVASGLATAVEYLEHFRFDDSDLAYLRTLKGSNGQTFFAPAFLEYLKGLRLTCVAARSG